MRHYIEYEDSVSRGTLYFPNKETALAAFNAYKAEGDKIALFDITGKKVLD